MAKGAKRKGRSRRWLLGAGGIVAALAVWGFVSCIPPRSFKAVKSPREGRAMNNTVAVVYSKHYQINLGGPERMHPFDIRKYSKIYLKLNTDGLLRPPDVFVPESVSRADLLRVHTPAYLESLKSSANVARYLEAPLVAAMPAKLVDAGILNAFRYASGGTILAGRKASSTASPSTSAAACTTPRPTWARGSASMPTWPSPSASSRARGSSSGR